MNFNVNRYSLFGNYGLARVYLLKARGRRWGGGLVPRTTVGQEEQQEGREEE